METLGKYTTQDFEERTDLIIESVNKHNLDILMAPEWYYLKLPHFTKEEKEQTLEKIIKNTPKETLIIPGTFIWIYKKIKKILTKDQLNFHNTAIIIYNGQIQEYHKYGNAGELGIEGESKNKKQNFKFTEGLEKGKIFSWKNLDLGLEICIEHELGGLKSKKRNLDLQLVVACGISLYPIHTTIKNKGHIIICDGYLGINKSNKEKFGNRIYQKDSDKLNKIQPIQYTTNLDLFEI